MYCFSYNYSFFFPPNGNYLEITEKSTISNVCLKIIQQKYMFIMCLVVFLNLITPSGIIIPTLDQNIQAVRSSYVFKVRRVEESVFENSSLILFHQEEARHSFQRSPCRFPQHCVTCVKFFYLSREGRESESISRWVMEVKLC